MEKQTPFTLIRKGFFIGLGLIPALALTEYAFMQYGIYASKKMTEEITVHLNEQNAQVAEEITLRLNKQNEQKDKTLSFPPDGMASDADTAISTDSSADTDGTASDKSIIYRTITDENDFNKSYIDDIELSAYKTRQQGKQLLITGHFINRADVEVNMIELEAELFNAGEFVYECGKYISSPIKTGKPENYMISCGCGNTDLPEFDQVKVKVARAKKY